MGGGQDKPAWTACPPGVKITRVGGKITRDSLPPGAQAIQGGQDKLLHRTQGGALGAHDPPPPPPKLPPIIPCPLEISKKISYMPRTDVRILSFYLKKCHKLGLLCLDYYMLNSKTNSKVLTWNILSENELRGKLKCPGYGQCASGLYLVKKVY